MALCFVVFTNAYDRCQQRLSQTVPVPHTCRPLRLTASARQPWRYWAGNHRGLVGSYMCEDDIVQFQNTFDKTNA